MSNDKGAKRRSNSSLATKEDQKSFAMQLSAMEDKLVQEELQFVSDASRRYKLPLWYTVAAMKNKLLSISHAKLPREERERKMYQHLQGVIHSFSLVHRRIAKLADEHFSGVSRFRRKRETLLREALDDACSSRSLYLFHGHQELDAVREVLWPAVEKGIALRLGLEVRIDDSVYINWLSDLLLPSQF